jgi:beta-mannanase
MEIPIARYPWQSQDPVEYIKSFRYFMTFKDSLPESLKRVWGPAGDRGSIEWWPGNDVVDLMSIAIYGLPDKNITNPKKQESFSSIFNRKIWRLRFIDKPLFITEFGVKGPEEFQTKWLEDAAIIIRDNPQIIGVNYFNMTDTPKAWGKIKPPDWSISKKTFHHFLDALKKE